MNRNSLKELAGRAYHAFSRITLNKANDDTQWQEASADGFNSDKRDKIEHVQSYGFTSVFLPRDQQKMSQGAGGENGEQPGGKSAEGIAVHMGGQRNHPVIIAVDDRRHRPRSLKPGESAQYDDQGQMTYLKRDGLYALSPKKVSMRHVKKDKQPSGQQGQSYKHEGEDKKVTAEIVVTEGKIQFKINGKVLGEVTDKGFLVGGSFSDKGVRQIHRKDDLDTHNDRAVGHAGKGWAV